MRYGILCNNWRCAPKEEFFLSTVEDWSDALKARLTPTEAAEGTIWNGDISVSISICADLVTIMFDMLTVD